MKTEWERDDRSLQRVSATALHQQQQLIFKLTPTQKEPAQLSSNLAVLGYWSRAFLASAGADCLTDLKG